MAFTPPAWLTKKYIEGVLQHDTKKVIKVLDIDIIMPIPKGDNYMCDIYQVQASYLRNEESLTISLIVKVPRENDGVMNDFIEGGATRREARIYGEYLPKVNELLNLHNERRFTANSYNSGMKDIVILEDLKPNGYRMVERVKQFDFAHAKLIMMSIATYHAVAYVIHEREPEFVKDIGKDLYYRLARKNNNIEKFIIQSTKVFAEEIKNIPELEKYSKRFHDYSDSAWESFIKGLDTKPHEFTVLNHGDCWMTNMMFKYNTQGEPESAILLDLQGPNYTTFAFDLMYFLYNSVQNDILQTSREELLDIYNDELNKKLKLFGSKRVLSRKEFYDQIHDHEIFLLYMNVNVLPWFIADPNTVTNVRIDDSLGDFHNNPIGQLYRAKKYKDIIVKRITDIADRGFF